MVRFSLRQGTPTVLQTAVRSIGLERSRLLVLMVPDSEGLIGWAAVTLAPVSAL